MAVTDKSLLDQLEPIARLSAGRKKELAELCYVEKVNKDIDPMRMNISKAAQVMYLIKGDLGLRYDDENKAILRGGTDAAKHPVNSHNKLKDTIALTNIDIMRIDMDLLDIMMTWDQLSGNDDAVSKAENKSAATKKIKLGRSAGDWMTDTGVFSAFNLQSGVFSHLPAANIEEMFKRMSSISVTAGQVIIQQGGEGDYYYLIEKGSAEVSRINDQNQPPVILATLQEGNSFGEEALVSDNKRNATVTMKTDGELLRLNKKDFVELLKAPLINEITMDEAKTKVANGTVWVDVRLPSEYKYDHIEGAINLPLNEIRKFKSELDNSKEYILYCQTGRRSAAAAFVLAQNGLKVEVLKNGVRSN
ncbi:MAG TPA: cyclic nucleotide-binding domain-containing protein [Methylotenera sp.]|nr:cyclic nucleotide-binding domain-containing protein [Methylotenera sp.]